MRMINGVVTLTRHTEHGAHRWPRDDGIAVLLRRQDSRPLQMVQRCRPELFR
jgi:hypothetical protein